MSNLPSLTWQIQSVSELAALQPLSQLMFLITLTFPSDRVFSHALNTVTKIRVGSEKPPPHIRLNLYGLYKQSMGMSLSGEEEEEEEEEA